MGAWYTERGVVIGALWARGIASPGEARNLLPVLDRIIAANLWEYRLVYADIVQNPCVAARDEMTTAHADQKTVAATNWWSAVGGSHWPVNEGDRADFAKGFVFGAALEIRESLLT